VTKFVGAQGASERVLADGRVVIPGEVIDLKPEDLKDEHNKRLVDEGQLLEAPKASTKKEGGE